MSGDILSVTMSNFEKIVNQVSLPIMLVFYSKKYPSCVRLMDTMELLASRYRENIQFGLVDVDIQSELADQLGIGGLPCVLVLRDGRLYANIGGELPLSHYKHLIEKLLKENAPANKRGLFRIRKHI